MPPTTVKSAIPLSPKLVMSLKYTLSPELQTALLSAHATWADFVNNTDNVMHEMLDRDGEHLVAAVKDQRMAQDYSHTLYKQVNDKLFQSINLTLLVCWKQQMAQQKGCFKIKNPKSGDYFNEAQSKLLMVSPGTEILQHASACNVRLACPGTVIVLPMEARVNYEDRGNRWPGLNGELDIFMPTIERLMIHDQGD